MSSTPAATADRWLKVFEPRPGAALRLFCFPYAGGGASVYRLWPRSLPADVEVIGVQPPGRESRWRDEPFRHVDPMADEATESLAPHFDRPFAFFGHSMGALLAHEVTRRLAKQGARMPERLIVSGRSGPSWPETHAPIHDLPRSEFIEELRRYSGTPEEVLQNEELMSLVEPLLRADFAVSESERSRPEPEDGEAGDPAGPLTVPVTAVGGRSDGEVPLDGLAAWSEVTTGPFDRHVIDGGHFFVNEQREETLDVVRRALAPHLGRSSQPGQLSGA